MIDLLLTGAAELLRGDGAITQDAALAIKDGRILAVGPTDEVLAAVAGQPVKLQIDATGKTVLPGFVDPHTHLVFAGSREGEYAQRLAGATYREIMAAGGGILSTVRATREAGEDELIQQGLKYLDQMLETGTTTAEVKSGYGLSTDQELKQLRVIHELNRRHPIDLVPTFMGAHEVPPEYRENRTGFVDLIIDEMLPAAAPLASFCDVFTEEGVFSVEESRRILMKAKELGLGLKVHADELSNLGGAKLAAEVGAISADHLLCIDAEGMAALAKAGTVGVLLPATAYFLMADYAPARQLLEAGVTVALATDFNPGSSPTTSMPFVIGLACNQMRLTPLEAITAATANAAKAIGKGAEVGQLAPGFVGDLLLLDAPNHQHLPYRPGTNLIELVIKGGHIVVDRRRTA